MLKMMMASLGIACMLSSCSREKITADLIIHHATIYSVDSSFTVYEAMCIKGGKVLAMGSNQDILKTYEAKETTDANFSTRLRSTGTQTLSKIRSMQNHMTMKWDEPESTPYISFSSSLS